MIIIFSLSSIEKENLYKLAHLIFLVSIISLMLVPLIGIEVKGSKMD